MAQHKNNTNILGLQYSAEYCPPEDRAYSLQNGAVMMVREEHHGYKVVIVGSMLGEGKPIQFGYQAACILRDFLLREFPLSLEQLNKMTPDATARELMK